MQIPANRKQKRISIQKLSNETSSKSKIKPQIKNGKRIFCVRLQHQSQKPKEKTVSHFLTETKSILNRI